MTPIISAHVVKDRSLGQFEHRGGQESCWTTSLMVAAPRLPGAPGLVVSTRVFFPSHAEPLPQA